MSRARCCAKSRGMPLGATANSDGAKGRTTTKTRFNQRIGQQPNVIARQIPQVRFVKSAACFTLAPRLLHIVDEPLCSVFHDPLRPRLSGLPAVHHDFPQKWAVLLTPPRAHPIASEGESDCMFARKDQWGGLPLHVGAAQHSVFITTRS